MFLKIITFPFKIIFLTPVYFFKFVISPFLPKTCIYYPTCSTYMIMAIKKHGPFKGIVLGTKRIFKCNPFHKGGFDPVPDNIKGELKWFV